MAIVVQWVHSDVVLLLYDHQCLSHYNALSFYSILTTGNLHSVRSVVPHTALLLAPLLLFVRFILQSIVIIFSVVYCISFLLTCIAIIILLTINHNSGSSSVTTTVLLIVLFIFLELSSSISSSPIIIILFFYRHHQQHFFSLSPSLNHSDLIATLQPKGCYTVPELEL